MSEPKQTDPRSPLDQLITRPDGEPLPTPLDPASPEARGYPADASPLPSADRATRTNQSTAGRYRASA